jgi:hypothetical protein
MEKREYIFFQQDGATTHTANNLLAMLCGTSTSALLVHPNLLHVAITHKVIQNIKSTMPVNTQQTISLFLFK